MKKLIYITYIFVFLLGCSKQKKSFIKEEKTSEIELNTAKEESKTDAKKNEVEKVKPILEIVDVAINNHKELSEQKIKQIVDIALLIQKEHVDIDLKNHALEYAKKIYLSKEEQLIKQELNNIVLNNIDSLIIKDLKIIDSQYIDDIENATYNFNIYTFKNGNKTVLNKTAKLQIKNEKTILNGKSYINIITKIVEIK